MKKNIIALLLVLAVVSFGVFAAPSPATFTVTTTVNDNSFMGVTEETYGTLGVGGEYTAFENLGVTASGEQTFEAYITSYSNHPAGYTLSMSATAMSNTTNAAVIHYTVGANSKSYDTETNTTAVDLFTTSALTAITGSSHELSLTVDADSFDAATTGSYTGTVTFTYTAN